MRRLLGWVLFAVLFSACVTNQSTQLDVDPTPLFEAETTSEEKPAGSAFLMQIDATGGLCAYGPCNRSTVIYQDGFARIIDGGGTVIEGLFDTATLEILVQSIYAADFDAIRSQPFTEECPTAYDGQEYIFTFYNIDGAQETVSSCEYALNLNASLFRTDYEPLINPQ